MLEHFKVPQDQAVMVREAPLRETVSIIFRKMGVNPEDSDLATDVLVKADMRGVETHGVSNMLRAYVSAYGSGELNNAPNWRITRETPATANIDSDRGLGIIVTPKAMEIAIEKAKNVGVGMVTIHNSRHLGMASYHAMMALDHDQIGTCMTSCPPLVLPTFGAEPRLGTNPIAVAAPADKEPPFVFDAATSTVAGNKLGLARRLGNTLLPGWVGDADGVPIMEEVDPRRRATRVARPRSCYRSGARASRGRTRATALRASWTSWAGYCREEASAWCRDAPTSDTSWPRTTSRRSWTPPSSSAPWTISSECCARPQPRPDTTASSSPACRSLRKRR